MKKNKLLLLALLASIAFSCKDTIVDPDTYAQGYEYYPLAVGDYRVYDVTAIIFKNNISDTSRYQLREEVTESFADQTNELNYKIVRSVRSDEQAAWVEDSVMVVAKSAENVLLTKDNTKYVKLVFPVQEGKVWLGDAFNNHVINDLGTSPYSRKEPYTYASIGEPFSFDQKSLTEANGGIAYDSTLTVLQGNYSENLTLIDKRKEVYSKNIGLVYRLFNRVMYAPCFPEQCEFGEGYKLYGNERHEILVAHGHN